MADTFTLSTVPAGFTILAPPLTLDRGYSAATGIFIVGVPGTCIIGTGETHPEAEMDLWRNVRWWFLREGPRVSAREFKHTKQTRRMLDEWRIVSRLLTYEVPGGG